MRLAQARVETNLKSQENAMMLIKVHERKGNTVAVDEAYEQITELQREIKVLKSKDQGLQSNDMIVKEKSTKRKKFLDDLLDKQQAYLNVSSNSTTDSSKPNADDESSTNPTGKSKGGLEDDTDDFLLDFRRLFDVQINDIPPMVGNISSQPVQVTMIVL